MTLPGGLPALAPLASYATCTYYAIHAFRFVDADGGAALRPLHARARGGRRRGSSPREARRRGRDYLQEDIRERLAQRRRCGSRSSSRSPSPATRSTTRSAVWPAERERVNAGTLELTALETERETGGDVLVFDPTRVTDGIELSDDPVLRFRHRRLHASRSRAGWS